MPLVLEQLVVRREHGGKGRLRIRIVCSPGVRRVLCGYATLTPFSILRWYRNNKLINDQDSPTPSSTQTTPSHAPTPTSNGPAGGRLNNGDASSSGNANSKAGGSSKNNKKKSGGNNKSGVDDGEDSDKPPMKRLKISYGRD